VGSYDVWKNDNRTTRTVSYGARSICDWAVTMHAGHSDYQRLWFSVTTELARVINACI